MFRAAYRFISARWNLLRHAWNYEEIRTYNELQRFETILNEHRLSLTQFSSILEFGCGFGRILKRLESICPRSALYGCEVDETRITKARSVCPKAMIFKSDIAPPLPLDHGIRFDLIYTYSVFTHLSEVNHKAWLSELSARLAPGGVMVHTLHGIECLKRLKLFSPQHLAKYRIDDLERFMASAPGYHYAVDDADRPEYGLALLSADYIMSEWPRITGLPLLDFQPGAIEAYAEGCQDVVVLGPK